MKLYVIISYNALKHFRCTNMKRDCVIVSSLEELSKKLQDKLNEICLIEIYTELWDGAKEKCSEIIRGSVYEID